MVKKIAQVGTFNVDNLGDLLFPIVFHEIISKLSIENNFEYEIDYYSPNATGYIRQYEDQKIVVDLNDFKNTYDFVFIGGGDLIRSDDWSINQIYEGNDLSFTGILSPTSEGIPNYYSVGMGVPFQLETDFAIYLKNSFDRFQRVSVRDERSQKFLYDAGISSEIVPDMVVSISKYIEKEQLLSVFNAAAARFNWNLRSGEYFIFQSNKSVIKDDELTLLADSLNKISSQLELPVVLLSIGECLGDNELYTSLLPLLTSATIINKESYSSLKLLDKVAVLANAKGFIGSSLHGNIISYSYEIPHFTFSGGYSNKLVGFFNLIKNESRCFEHIDSFKDNHQMIVSSFISESNEFGELGKLADNVEKYINQCVVGPKAVSDNNRKSSEFSPLIDQLYKTSQENNLTRNLELSRLWERVHYSEKLAVRLTSENQELWKRVNEGESQLAAERKQVGELWKRTGLAENLNDSYASTVDQLNKELENKQYELMDKQQIEQRLRELSDENKQLMSSMLYYLKKKINGKG